MGSTVMGIALATAAAGMYAVGIALQAAEARAAASDYALRLSLLRRLVRRPRWLVGTALGLSGWALQALALIHASLTVVQPTLGLGLVFLLAVSAKVLGERARVRELLGVALIVAAVPVLGWLAPERSLAHAAGVRLFVPLALIGIGAGAPYAVRGRARPPSVLLPISAGLAYAWDGIATKIASDDYAGHLWVGLGAWFLAMNLASGIGTLSEMSALQRCRVTQVAPLVFSLTTFVPVASAPLIVGEGWPTSPARAAGLIAALLCVASGAGLLATSEPLEGLLATPSNRDSGTARSPRACSADSSASAAARSSLVPSSLTTTMAPRASEPSSSAP